MKFSKKEIAEDRNSDSENEESGHRVKKLKVSKRKQPPSSDIQMDCKAMTILYYRVGVEK